MLVKFPNTKSYKKNHVVVAKISVQTDERMQKTDEVNSRF
jgi:hypothetical protein